LSSWLTSAASLSRWSLSRVVAAAADAMVDARRSSSSNVASAGANAKEEEEEEEAEEGSSDASVAVIDAAATSGWQRFMTALYASLMSSTLEVGSTPRSAYRSCWSMFSARAVAAGVVRAPRRAFWDAFLSVVVVVEDDLEAARTTRRATRGALAATREEGAMESAFADIARFVVARDRSLWGRSLWNRPVANI
jgi:hypothetical protein